MVVKIKSTSREWYKAYCAAMLEPDVNKVFTCVQSARRAIEERARELGSGFASNNHESKELDRALYFLTMLLNCSCPDQESRSTANLSFTTSAIQSL